MTQIPANTFAPFVDSCNSSIRGICDQNDRPGIPRVWLHGIPLRDEIELEMALE